MDIIRENSYTFENGHTVKVVTMATESKERRIVRQVLVDEDNEIISPEVKSIKFDKENQLFLVRDKLAIDEFMTGSIYFYVNYQGIPVGMCFFDLKNGFYDISFDTVKEFKEAYFNYKLHLTQLLREEVIIKTEKDIENCKKMALYKKGVIESENKI